MISRSGACFPVHYIYGWLGLYFETHYEIDVPGPKIVVYSGKEGLSTLMNMKQGS